MPWIRKQHTSPDCDPPSAYDGDRGDLWRCSDCMRLWRVASACDVCDRNGRPTRHGGQHPVGQVWRPARTWQRILNFWH